MCESGPATAALPYLLRVREDPEVAPFFAEDDLWRLLGEWICDGHTYRFNADYTCMLDGVSRCYSVEGYHLLTGADMEQLTRTHRLAQVTDTRMIVQVIDGDALDLTRTGSCDLPSLPE